jgi:hypothetical protein
MSELEDRLGSLLLKAHGSRESAERALKQASRPAPVKKASVSKAAFAKHAAELRLQRAAVELDERIVAIAKARLEIEQAMAKATPPPVIHVHVPPPKPTRTRVTERDGRGLVVESETRPLGP